MELELRKETYSCYDALPPVTQICEQSMETIIPDYCPDIARVVESSGCLFLRSCEITEGKAVVSGTLRVTLLYIADGNGGLKSFEYPIAFEQTLETRLRDGCSKAHCTGTIQALETRTLNPRKITTRVSFCLTVIPYSEAQLSVCTGIDGQSDYGIETLCATQEITLIQAVYEKDFVFSDELLLSSGKEPASELLRSRVQPRVTECRCIGSKMILKGIVCVALLYLSEAGTLCRAEGELPFSQILDGMEGADDGTSCEAFVQLTGMELRIGGEENNARSVGVKLFLHAFALLRQRRMLPCITDLYSVDHELSAQMQTMELCGGVQTVLHEQMVREQLETGVEPSDVLLAEVSFGNAGMVREEKEALVRCTAAVRVLYLDEGGAPLLAERRIELSTRAAVAPDCRADVTDVTAREVSAAVSAGGIEVRFPALFTLECAETHRSVSLCALKAEPLAEGGSAAPSLVLRALAPGQKLWDLAKEYRTTVAEILSANEFTGDADAGAGEMLLIPRKR